MTTTLSVATCALAVDGAPLLEDIHVVDGTLSGRLVHPFRGKVEADSLEELEQLAREARDEQAFGVRRYGRRRAS